MILSVSKYNNKGHIYYMSALDSKKGFSYITRKEFDILKKNCIRRLDLSGYNTPELIEHYDSFFFFKRYLILTSQKAYKQACKDRDLFVNILNRTNNQEKQLIRLSSLIQLFESTSEKYN